MNKLYFRFVLLILVLTCKNASANFGLGPCCSGAPCGIIPCDTSCAGKAFGNLGTSMQNSFLDINNNLAEVQAKYSEMNTKTIELYESLSQSDVKFKNSTIETIDRQNTSIGLEIEKVTKQILSRTSNRVTSLKGVKNLSLAEFSEKKASFLRADSIAYTGQFLQTKKPFTSKSLKVNLSSAYKVKNKTKTGFVKNFKMLQEAFKNFKQGKLKEEDIPKLIVYLSHMFSEESALNILKINTDGAKLIGLHKDGFFSTVQTLNSAGISREITFLKEINNNRLHKLIGVYE